jgi:hypothetical protein
MMFYMFGLICIITYVKLNELFTQMIVSYFQKELIIHVNYYANNVHQMLCWILINNMNHYNNILHLISVNCLKKNIVKKLSH